MSEQKTILIARLLVYWKASKMMTIGRPEWHANGNYDTVGNKGPWLPGVVRNGQITSRIETDKTACLGCEAGSARRFGRHRVGKLRMVEWSEVAEQRTSW